MSSTRYRKRPVEIDAIQWTGDNLKAILRFTEETPGDHAIAIDTGAQTLGIHTLEGVMTATVGDWIVRGIENELYPCKPGIFAATYEPVEEEGDRA